MNRKFWLKRIELRKSPGFALGSFPPITKLGAFLNVVWGPNAVGKSTLARAMRALIWDNKASSEVLAEAEGLLEGPDVSWNLSLSQGELKQTRLSDNQEVALPGRNDELSESYWFPLHELLQEDGGHTATFLQQVRKRMQGGVDLDASKEAAGAIPSFARSTTTQTRLARTATEKRNAIIRKQSEHQNIQDKIDRLQEVVDQGKELPIRKTLLEDARFLLDLQQRIGSQEQELSSYSSSIELVDKSSLQRLLDLKTAMGKADEELRRCMQREQELQNSFEASVIEESVLSDIDKPGRISNLYSAYKDALLLQKTKEEECSKAEKSVQEWETQHAWLVDDPPEELTLQRSVHTLRAIAEACEPLRCKVDADRRLLEELGEDEVIDLPVRELLEAQYRLSDWIESFWRLQESTGIKGSRPGSRIWLILSALLIGGLSLFFGILYHPGFFGGGIVLILLSILWFVPSPRKGSKYAQAEEDLKKAKLEAEKLLFLLGKDSPSSWTVDACQALVLDLGYSIVLTQERERLNQRRALAREHLQASKSKLQDWMVNWQDAASALGLNPDEAGLEKAQFFHFSPHLKLWNDLRLEQVRTGQSLAFAQTETQRCLSALQEELDTTTAEVHSLKAMVDGFVSRFREATSLKVKLGENAQKLLFARKELHRCEDSLKQFWKDLNLTYGDETELKEISSQLDDWNALNHSLKYDRALYRQKIEERPEALEISISQTDADLASDLKRVERELEAMNESWQELGRLQETFDMLSSGSELADAQLEEREALAQLESFREEQVMAMMISEIASDLKEESERRFQPQVLTHASEWLSRITNHRYTLSANNQGFFAKDSFLARTFSLDELSSGTRIQLLFSIRMAFITMQEASSDVHLPIFLDELMANSDDERALAIAAMIGKIAEERQVFYFTAQQDEVEKLKTIATSAVTVLPLEDLKRGFKVTENPLKPISYETRQIPPPLEDYQEYGKTLQVAGPSLWEPIESLHSWHLLFDSEELYQYLLKGWRHVGQLASALHTRNPLMVQRITLLQKTQKAAQKGRCRVLHLQDLEDPALTLNRSSEYWAQIEGVIGPDGITGNELLQAIEEKKIQRFSEKNLEILSQWLLEQRFASDQREDTAEEILSTLFVECEELVAGSGDQRVIQRWLGGVLE